MFLVLQIEKTISSAENSLTEEVNLLYENSCHLINQSLQVCIH